MKLSLIVIACIIAFFSASAQSNYITDIESLYNQGQYQKTLQAVDSVLRSEKNLSDTVLMQLYSYQAFSYVALDKKESAINTFRYLLIIDPNISLDPRFVSPKIIEVFEESKRRVGDTIKAKPTILIPNDDFTDNVSINNSIRNRAMKSLLYPGLGQLSVNNKTRGYIFLGGETVSLLGLIASHLLTNVAHNKYLDNRDINKMDDLYNNYSKWYRVRTGFIISSVSIWLINYIDATIFN